MRKIVVTTPTGNVGSRVVRLLVQAGARPVVFIRSAATLPRDLVRYVDIVEGDQGDRDAVVKATIDADALFWVDPPTDDDDPIAGYARMGASAANAVTTNRIPRVVFQSSVGAEQRAGLGEIDGLGQTEEALNATGASVLHLRCGYFFSNLLTDIESVREGVLRTTLPLDLTFSWVDPRDIGDVVAARLLNAEWSGIHTQAVHGPQDLSFEQVAEVLTRVLQHPVRAEKVSDDQVRAELASFGMSPRQVEGIVGMSAGMRDEFVAENPRDVFTTTPTSLEAWAAANLVRALEPAS